MLEVPRRNEERFTLQEIIERLTGAGSSRRNVFIGAKPIQDVQDALLSDGEAAEVAQRIYRNRRMRSSIFSSELFGEAAWDMLLDLYIQEHSRTRVSVTSATLASTQPPTTALRWLSVIEAQGLVERFADDTDGRRMWVRLTSKGRDLLKQYLSEI